jgi:hypothetical protein
MTSVTSGEVPGQRPVDEAEAQVGTDVTSTAQEQVASVANASMNEAKSVANDATSHAKEVLSQSQAQLRQQADEQLRSLSRTLSDIGRQLTTMTHGQPQQGIVADVANDLASQLSRFADRADQRGVDGLLQDVSRFARKKPGLFLLASFGGGVVSGRLLRTADQHGLMEAAKSANGPSNGGSSRPDSIDITGGI